MNIIMATREFSGVGRKWSGQADMVRALSTALVKEGVKTTVIMPLGDESQIVALASRSCCDFTVHFRDKMIHASAYEIKAVDTALPDFIFIKMPSVEIGDPYFSGNETSVEKRFGLFFDRAAVAFLETHPHDFDLVHAHTKVDFLAYFAKQRELKLPVLYTIHSLERKEDNIFLRDEFNELSDCETKEAKVDPFVFALTYSDRLTTVSEQYAKELKAKKTRYKDLVIALTANAKKLTGILNGLDRDFTPMQLFLDRLLPYNINLSETENKQRAHLDLQEMLKLPKDPNIPILLWSQRLVEAKGAMEFSGGINSAIPLGMQVVIFGRGEERYEFPFVNKDRKFPNQIRFVRFNQFNSSFEPSFIAGSDLVILPSLEEPCGLLALKAMRLGTLPFVNPVGGLAQIVKDNVNGFTIPKGISMEDSIGDRLKQINELFRNNKPAWLEMQKKAMDYDSFWPTPAEKYIKIYQQMLA